MNKFDKSNFLNAIEVDGVIERDLVNNYWNLFRIKRDVSYFTISYEFIYRPDLLSIYLYGTMKYWWILMKVNQIDDIWNDLTVEKIIVVPDYNDYEDWLIEVTAQKRLK